MHKLRNSRAKRFNHHFFLCAASAFCCGAFLILLPRSLGGLLPSVVTTSLHCEEATCKLSNACVNSLGELQLYGTEPEVSKQVAKIATFNTRFHKVKTYSSRFGGSSLHVRGMRERAVLIDRYDDNCGHIIADEVYTAYRLVLETSNFRNSPQPSVGDVILDHSGTARCDEWFRGISERVVTLPSNSTSCYKEVIFGTSGKSFADGYGQVAQRYLSSAKFNEDMLYFRQLHYHKARVSTRVSHVDKILIMEKKHGMHMVNIANIDELQATAVSEFPKHTVLKVSWSNYNINQQIELLSQTKLLVSLSGSDVINGIFLPSGSYLLIYCRYVDGVKEASNEKALWYNYLKYIQTIEFCEDGHLRLQEQNVLVNISHAAQVFRDISLGITSMS